MAAPLELNPASAGLSEVPWPPRDPNKRSTVVKSGESFLDVCKRENCAFADLMKCNFELDINNPGLQGKWQRIVNYYLRTKLKCTRLTQNGNYMFSGGETIYIPTIAPIPIDLSTTRRLSLRRTMLDKTLSKLVIDTETGGSPWERTVEKVHEISWRHVYKGYDPKTGMFIGTPKPPADPGADSLISNPSEQVVAEETIETPADHVLVRVMVQTLIVQVSPKFSARPIPEFTYGGYVMNRRREFFYGPGHKQQQVQVIEQVTIRKPDGTMETKPAKATYSPQPKSLDF